MCLVNVDCVLSTLLSVLYGGSFCCVCQFVCWWQCGVVKNYSAWLVLVSVGFVE